MVTNALRNDEEYDNLFFASHRMLVQAFNNGKQAAYSTDAGPSFCVRHNTTTPDKGSHQKEINEKKNVSDAMV